MRCNECKAGSISCPDCGGKRGCYDGRAAASAYREGRTDANGDCRLCLGEGTIACESLDHDDPGEE